ncbi:uncharacterized protein LOC113557263 isoform X2 [Rhopalosiphum maidis]|uniref:uncharacterized protein LOC113557263 isoform X2 n=1 Tax=Rhopalosiphum maidis TaxID=43146 RepID=UPI000EFED64D|nr:uncharacterized protein LOC113557263 isoform X2 [Rhopalosiphum maidis]
MAIRAPMFSGTQGRHSDGGVFDHCSLRHMIEQNKLHIPENFVFVGDEAFPLKSYLMRPYPRRELNANCKIFNYRLSRARRTVENAFGILVSRFRVFEKPIATSVPTAVKIVKTACALHNWLQTRCDSNYFSLGLIDKEDLEHYTFLHLVHGEKNLKVMDLSSYSHYLQDFLITVQENLEIFSVIISMELEQCHGKMK